MTVAAAMPKAASPPVLGDADSIENHIRDTFTAGADLCDPDATRLLWKIHALRSTG